MRWGVRARAFALTVCSALAIGGAWGIPPSASAELQRPVVVEPQVDGRNTPAPYAAPRVTVTAEGLNSKVTITNPASNADLGGSGIITSANLEGPDGWTANLPGNPNTSFTENGAFTYTTPTTSTVGDCPPVNLRTIGHVTTDQIMPCFFAVYSGDTASGGIVPGQTATITYPTSVPDLGDMLFSVYVSFDYDDLWPKCRPGGYSDALAWTATKGPLGFARDCVPPLQTKITSVKINYHAHTAGFKQTAQHATTFFCQLYRGGHQMFARKCGATKAYTHRLPSGTYTYTVWGQNNHGRSPLPGSVEFKLK